jgi:hypothetical protein
MAQRTASLAQKVPLQMQVWLLILQFFTENELGLLPASCGVHLFKTTDYAYCCVPVCRIIDP